LVRSGHNFLRARVQLPPPQLLNCLPQLSSMLLKICTLYYFSKLARHVSTSKPMLHPTPALL
jgi:hypothetical protein